MTRPNSDNCLLGMTEVTKKQDEYHEWSTVGITGTVEKMINISNRRFYRE